ncbi:MAG TPA: MBL fold metallo-hydrolase [Spirochaetota bacterium]|nr:MBL fold metallo-hydrolase [Spirochaetota bacterium]HPJ34011.1 MBL fold metallo-hydrolase [Spirochaetota bacterium]
MIQKIDDRISVFFTEEGFSKSNSILIDDDIRVMIDSGPGRIISEARPETVDILLNSHGHLDHVWDNDLFINARILTHPLERENFRDYRSISALDRWDDFMTEDPMDYLNSVGTIKESFFGEWRVDGTVDEGDIVDAGKTRIEVMHLPGHTSGHLGFFFPEQGLLFCGDICLTKVGPWYGDAATPVDYFIDSIDRIIHMKPERVVSGHNRRVLSSGIKEAFEEYRGRIFMRDEKVLKAITESPRTVHDLASMKLIYPAHPSIFVLYWEKSMIIKHLERLISHGLAEQVEDGRYTAG